MDKIAKRTAELFNSSPLRKSQFAGSPLQKRLNTQVAPLSEQTRPVTPQQWRFIHALVEGDGTYSLNRAAIAAGYKAKSAHVTALELTDPKKYPHVVAAIQQYRSELAERYGTTVERHMRDLQIIRDKAIEAGNYSAAVQAEYRRGQALGTIYVDRKEIRHGTIDSMSVEEVRRKLEEIKLLYGDPSSVIDVTPIAEGIAGEEVWRENYHESDEDNETDDETDDEADDETDDEIGDEAEMLDATGHVEDVADVEIQSLPAPQVPVPQEPVRAKSIIDVMREAQVDKLAITSKSKWRKS